jgi:hypothetical protein
MKAFPKVGLLVVVALLATAAAATSAQAVTIDPDGVAVHGESDNSSLTYGVAFITCDRATADGNIDHAIASDRITDLALTFTGNCAVAGVGAAEVDCVGTVTLIADEDADDTGTVELNEGFACTVTTATCTVTVSGPQTTDPKNTFLDEPNQVLEADVNVDAERQGNILCGPAQGEGAFTADYDITTNPDDVPPDPFDVTINP